MKKHLEVLDGLRGTAALSVLVFHFQEMSIGISNPDSLWLRHAHLAVDFFFCLSGYVIAYAYDDRRNRMSVAEFFRARLIRLHPLVVFGIFLGLASYLFDPFNNPVAGGSALQAWIQPQQAPLWTLAANIVGGVLMIPTWGLPNRFDIYFSLNIPAWSLMWEYLANIVFALVLWRAKKPVVMIVVVLAAIGVGFCAHSAGNVSLGYAWGQFPHALARTAFSFCMGLLLFRTGAAIRSSFGFGSLSIFMLILFMMPVGSLNWLYEFIVTVAVLPLVVAVGAGAQTSGALGRLCQFCGRISYPVYILHYAVVTMFINYHWTRGIDAQALPWVIAALTALVIAFSYAVLVLYDEPVRRWLSRKAKRGAAELAAAPIQ